MLKTYTLQDWAAFLEVFGMPLRVGKYDNGASPEEKRILLRAVRDLGADAAAIIPKGMEIDFIEAKGGQGNAVFGAMTEYLDKQVSKAVIGQTMTTDEGSSRSQSETHNEVRLDIKKSDARQISTTLNRDLIEPFVEINFPGKKAPVVSLPVDDPEDTEKLASTLSQLVPLGLRVASADVNKRMGFRVPDKDEPVLVSGQAVVPAMLPPETASSRPCANCGGAHLASEQDDPLVVEAMSEWEANITPAIEAILKVAKASKDYDEFLAALDQINLDTDPLAKRLATQMMKAKGDGVFVLVP